MLTEEHPKDQEAGLFGGMKSELLRHKEFCLGRAIRGQFGLARVAAPLILLGHPWLHHFKSSTRYSGKCGCSCHSDSRFRDEACLLAQLPLVSSSGSSQAHQASDLIYVLSRNRRAALISSSAGLANGPLPLTFQDVENSILSSFSGGQECEVPSPGDTSNCVTCS